MLLEELWKPWIDSLGIIHGIPILTYTLPGRLLFMGWVGGYQET